MSDLFENIDRIFSNEPPEDPQSAFILHRFLASDQDFAPFVASISRRVKDDDMVWEIWRTALPDMGGAPYLTYAAPKKPKQPEELVIKYMDYRRISRSRAEDELEIIRLEGLLDEVKQKMGVE